MMRGTHARDDGSFGRSASTQTLKGAALLGVAVLIGILLLKTAPHVPTTVTSGLGPGTTKAPKVSPATTVPDTSSTTAAPRPPSVVHVLVANGAGVINLGARIRSQLSTAGYNTDKPAIDAPTSDHTVSSIYFQTGFEAEALQLATVLSLAPSVVQPMPTTNPPVPAAQLTGADVLVIAGQDVAGTSTQTTSAPGPTVAPSQTPRTTVVVHHSTTTTVVHHSTTTTAPAHTTTTSASHSTTTIK